MTDQSPGRPALAGSSASAPARSLASALAGSSASAPAGSSASAPAGSLGPAGSGLAGPGPVPAPAGLAASRSLASGSSALGSAGGLTSAHVGGTTLASSTRRGGEGPTREHRSGAVFSTGPSALLMSGLAQMPLTGAESPRTERILEKARTAGIQAVAPWRAALMATSEKPKSYAATVKSRLNPPHLLTVQAGTEERSYIREETFSRLIDVVEKHILNDQSEVALTLQCAFKRWSGGWGLLGCLDQATADYLVCVVAGVKIDSNSFRAWRKGEQGRLLKMSYTPEITNIPAGKPVMDRMV